MKPLTKQSALYAAGEGSPGVQAHPSQDGEIPITSFNIFIKNGTCIAPEVKMTFSRQSYTGTEVFLHRLCIGSLTCDIQRCVGPE